MSFSRGRRNVRQRNDGPLTSLIQDSLIRILAERQERAAAQVQLSVSKGSGGVPPGVGQNRSSPVSLNFGGDCRVKFGKRLPLAFSVDDLVLKQLILSARINW